MIVSLCSIAYNEEDNIGYLFKSILEQTYPHDKIELVLVDGISTDKTRELMNAFCMQHKSEFFDVKIKENPKRVQPAGWNVAIENSVGDVIIRVDSHSVLDKEFVSNNVRCIEQGADVCGGKRTNIMKNGRSALLLAELSMFGSGVADFRRGTEKKYVNTVAQACYKKEVFNNVGRFNEKLLRSEDNEMHYRIRKAGYKICYDDSIVSEYFTRPTLKGMLRQKFGNGKYVGITTKISPKVFNWYHYVPCLFVLCAIAALAMLICSFCFSNPYLSIPFAAGVGVYLLADIALSILSCKQAKNKAAFFPLLILFPLLHFAYGSGTVIGFLEMPFINLRTNEERLENQNRQEDCKQKNKQS